MPFLGVLGPARTHVRSAVFDLCRRILMTEDGRRMLADSLEGLTRVGVVSAPQVNPRSIYPELPAAAHEPPPLRPVFITARFRSGSTLLWNIFRHVPECRAFYEPLNERRWFDPGARGTKVDSTHLGVREDRAEYEGLESLSRWYREEWTSRRLFMSEDEFDLPLASYIRALVAAAPRRAVLQFNRVDFRLPWLRRSFPEATILHLYRHPRDQWCSTLPGLESVPPTATIEEFAPHDGYYLLPWARDLSYQFPFLDPRAIEHPYDLFYLIWRLSYVFGATYADRSFSFEQLCASPDAEIPQLMASAGITDYSSACLQALIDGRPTSRHWREYASDGWFQEREGRCEEVFSTLRFLC